MDWIQVYSIDMKKVFAIAACVLALSSCVFSYSGDMGKKVKCKGPVITKDFDLTGFEAITINGGADMEIIQGDEIKVSVKANEEVFNHLDYEVSGSTLIIKTKDDVGIRAEEYDITVTLPLLTAVTVNGAGDLDIKNGYVSDNDLEIEINGAGDIEMTGVTVPSLAVYLNGAGGIDANDLNVEKLSVHISGAGDVDVSGKAGSAIFSVSGAGDIDAVNLDCDNVQTHKSGIASIRLK